MVASHRTLNWGRTRYRDALARQQVLVAQRLAKAVPDTLVLTEHEPVYTLGARPGADQHLLWDEATRATAGVEVVKINRGGDVTFHGPGQLVGYAFLDLTERGRDLHAYLRQLEEALIQALAGFGLEAGRREGKTGIWLAERKIAAIGVAVRRWVTYHGFALNVSTDLRYFGGIVPCGITDGSVTSLEAELGQPVDAKAVAEAVTTSFWRQFAAPAQAVAPN
ncbi:MAG: lipoyl(octanoyl) transferase LipB [Verrucomicrobiota bacterium JB022]|nr:lipoyl(octanoyl) transferase LipB [Verrucomicrobiota bacterium JB022]